LKLLKEISPGTGLMVVGLTDMAYQDGDVIKSYPNIPKIINAQRNASLNSEAIFWDAYTAMGGRSTIIKWFGMNPPLAKKDYVHLTDQGADTLARMMISDLFTINDPDPFIKTPPDVLIDTVALAKAGNISVPVEGPEKQGYLRSLVSVIFSYDPDKPFIFSAAEFWIFFLLVLAGFSLVYKKLFQRNFYLLLVSLFFYYKTGGLFLFLLLFVTFIDFSCGLLIHRSKTKFWRRSILLLSIISNIGILAYFKYTGFFVQAINDIIGTDIVVKDYLGAILNSLIGTDFNVSSIILPVGISFFTFQSLSYTIDMYRRKLDPVRNIFDFGFYVSFFPQLVAGPIVRASEFIPQLYKEYSLSQREFSHALFLIIKGLIKKIIISDFIAVNFIDRIFDLPTAYSGFENLMAVYGYGLQIYCDFSGYTDIAIGLALILGFRLPFNFNSPYKASSVTDFWKRWHISLSQWLRDYLYIPLGGNKKGKFRTYINLMITMLLGGLWHGASLRFVIWGGLHGIGLVTVVITRPGCLCGICGGCEETGACAECRHDDGTRGRARRTAAIGNRQGGCVGPRSRVHVRGLRSRARGAISERPIPRRHGSIGSCRTGTVEGHAQGGSAGRRSSRHDRTNHSRDAPARNQCVIAASGTHVPIGESGGPHRLHGRECLP
jgi:D-alanyl-lipoteichoic acid acyltransferase DltB (MBOAT superfamily)